MAVKMDAPACPSSAAAPPKVAASSGEGAHASDPSNVPVSLICATPRSSSLPGPRLEADSDRESISQ